MSEDQVWMAPVGTDLEDTRAWKQVGWVSEDGFNTGPRGATADYSIIDETHTWNPDAYRSLFPDGTITLSWTDDQQTLRSALLGNRRPPEPAPPATPATPPYSGLAESVDDMISRAAFRAALDHEGRYPR